MRYVKQFTIILFVSFLGEIIHYLVPLPVPASIYGLIIMLAALSSGVVKTASVYEAGRFLIDIMPLTFIPAAAGLINVWAELKPVLLPFAVITFVSTVAVMGVSGKVTQLVLKHSKKMGK